VGVLAATYSVFFLIFFCILFCVRENICKCCCPFVGDFWCTCGGDALCMRCWKVKVDLDLLPRVTTERVTTFIFILKNNKYSKTSK
jgi:hypothetical protein